MPSSLDFLLVAALGALVGAGELVSRYRDAPWSAVRNQPAAAYLAVNAIATVAALAITRIFDFTFGADTPQEQRAIQVLVAGFGAIALFRTSLFVVRVGTRDIGIGPITLLQVLLFATDRDVDRRRAVKRAAAVTTALRGLTFAQVKDALPRYCLTLMQNVSKDEESDVQKQAQEIAQSDMEDALKVNALGLSLMNIVGQLVLEAAAAAVQSRIFERGVLGEVYPRLYEALPASRDPDEKRLDVIGLTLYTAWPNIRSWLEDEARSPLQGWTIVLRLIDSEMPAADCAAWLDDKWIEEAHDLVADIEDFARSHRELLERQGVTMTIRPYSVVPAFHGFRLGSGTYIMSFLRWDETTGKLARPHHGYELFPPDDSSPRAVQYKGLFDNWVRRIDGASG